MEQLERRAEAISREFVWGVCDDGEKSGEGMMVDILTGQEHQSTTV